MVCSFNSTTVARWVSASYLLRCIVLVGVVCTFGLVGCAPSFDAGVPGPRVEGMMPTKGGPLVVVELTQDRVLHVCSADPDRANNCVSVDPLSDAALAGLPVVLPDHVVEYFARRSPYADVPDGEAWVARMGCPRFDDGIELSDAVEIRLQLIEQRSSLGSSTSVVHMGPGFGMDSGMLGDAAPYVDVQCQGNGWGNDRQAVHVLHVAADGHIQVYRERLASGEVQGALAL